MGRWDVIGWRCGVKFFGGFFFRGFAEGVDFFWGEESVVAFGEAFEGDGAELDADEALDFVSEAVEHVADLAVEALCEGDAEGAWGEGLDVLALGVAAWDGESVCEFFGVSGVVGAVEGDVVDFGDFVAGMGEGVGPGAVVGDEEEAFALFVEAADVEGAGPVAGEELVDGFFGVLWGGGAGVAFGFVEDGVDGAGWGERASAVGDGVGGVDLGGEGAGDLAVDGDEALEDEGFDGAA